MHAVSGASGLEEYERQFAALAGATRAVAFTYARSALVAIFRAAGLRDGDEVLLSPLTCKVVPLAILSAGFRPVYADVDASTLNLDAARLADAVTTRTRAVLFQRTYGLAAGASETIAFATSRGLLCVEDSAQCMPAPASWSAAAAIFSLNGGKPLSAGSGGVAVFREPGLASAVGALRDALPPAGAADALRARANAWMWNRVLTPRLYWPAFRLNQRASASYRPRPLPEEIAAEVTATSARPHSLHIASGTRALAHAGRIARHREACCAWYAGELGALAGAASSVPSGASLYYFPVLVERKPELLAEAARQGLEIVPWPISTPIYPVADTEQLSRYGYAHGSCPVAECVARRLVGLPTHPRVREHDRQRVVALVRDFMSVAP